MESLLNTPLSWGIQKFPIFIQNTIVTDDVILSPKFFVAIIAGVILALAFQLILTALSVALGITAIGNLKEKFVTASNATSDQGNDTNPDEFDQDYGSSTPTRVKITSAFGIWSVITTCISLFGATALAINLSMLELPQTGITIGLVIWGLFFIIMFYLETRIANTVIGSLINTAVSGLRSSGQAMKQLFATSKERKMNKIVDHTVDRIKTEMDNSLDTNRLSEVLDNFLQKINSKIPDYEQLKGDLKEIAKKSRSKNSTGKWMAIQQVLTSAIDKNKDSKDPSKKGKVEKAKELLSQIKTSYQKDEGKVEGLKNVISDLTSLEKEEIDQRIERIKKQIQQSTSEKLTNGELNEELKKMIKDPKLAANMITEQFSKLNRATIIDALDKNTNVNRDDLNRYADTIEGYVARLKTQFDKENLDRVSLEAESRIARFFNSTNREELEYDLLKKDVLQIIDNPRDSFTIIKNRINTFDKGTVKALVTNNRYIQEDQIDRVSRSLEDAKNQVSDKLTLVETKARQQMELLKRKAVIQAEHTRKTAAAAAWWLVITATFSAGASVLGVLIS